MENRVCGTDTKETEVDIMPAVESIERERVAYVDGMDAYLRNLKKMRKTEAKKKSHANLVKCQILKENGEFTDRYKQRC